MKILITSAGDGPESQVDPRFGRAERFTVFDTETGEYTSHDNAQNLHAAQGAGIQAAQAAVALGVEWVVTGHCGPKAFQTLKAAGLKIATGADGTVRETAERFMQGGFDEIGSADVEGHW